MSQAGLSIIFLGIHRYLEGNQHCLLWCVAKYLGFFVYESSSSSSSSSSSPPPSSSSSLSKWHYSPMRTFSSLMDFSLSVLFFDVLRHQHVYKTVDTQTSILPTPQPTHDLLFRDKEVMISDYFNIVSTEHCIDIHLYNQKNMHQNVHSWLSLVLKKSVAGWQWFYVSEVAAMYSRCGKAQCLLLS